MSELKPCPNCGKYPMWNTMTESDGEMFRRLFDKYNERFLEALDTYFNIDFSKTGVECLFEKIKDEQEAKKIMREVEKKLIEEL